MKQELLEVNGIKQGYSTKFAGIPLSAFTMDLDNSESSCAMAGTYQRGTLPKASMQASATHAPCQVTAADNQALRDKMEALERRNEQMKEDIKQQQYNDVSLEIKRLCQ